MVLARRTLSSLTRKGSIFERSLLVMGFVDWPLVVQYRPLSGMRRGMPPRIVKAWTCVGMRRSPSPSQTGHGCGSEDRLTGRINSKMPSQGSQ